MKPLFNRKLKIIPFTPDGYQKLLAEKNDLVTQRPEAIEDLRRARELGDLSENEYYRSARSKLSAVDARLRKLNFLIKSAKVVVHSHQGFVEIGSKVTINDGNQDYIYTIVGGFESNPFKQTISHGCPLGKALMGKKSGEQVVYTAPSGTKIYKIISIE